MILKRKIVDRFKISLFGILTLVSGVLLGIITGLYFNLPGLAIAFYLSGFLGLFFMPLLIIFFAKKKIVCSLLIIIYANIEHGFKYIIEAGDTILADKKLNHFELSTKLLTDKSYQVRMLATYIFGQLSAKNSKALKLLETKVATDENW
ncbi:MAG: hypothetical protein ABI374_10485 [Ginsengibacter sp.]